MNEQKPIQDRVNFLVEQIERWVFEVSTRGFSCVSVYDRPLLNYLEMKLATYIIKDCCALLDELKDKPEYSESYGRLKESYDVLREFIYDHLREKQDKIEWSVSQLRDVDSYSMWSFPLR